MTRAARPAGADKDAASPRAAPAPLPAVAAPAALVCALPRPASAEATGLVTLYGGGAGPGLFVVPGVIGPTPAEMAGAAASWDGRTVRCFPLLAPLRQDGGARPVERLAASHLAEVRRVQPAGPYHFAGFAFGGLIALEMARQAGARGDRVELLALVDSFLPVTCWGWRSRARTWKHWRDLQGAGAGLASSDPPQAIVASGLAPVWANLAAAQDYRPSAYDGHVTFVRSENLPALPDSPGREWRQFVRSVEVIELAGARPKPAGERLRLVAQALARELRPYPRIDLTMA